MVLSVPRGGEGADGHRKNLPAESLHWPETETVFVYDNTPYSFGDVKKYHTEILNEGQKKPLGRGELRQAVDSMVLDMALYEEALANRPKIPDSPEVISIVARFRLPYLRKIYYEKEVAPKAAMTLDDYAASLPLPGVRYEISMIVAEDQDKINRISEKLKRGEDFASLARKESEGLSADKGGKMGLVREGSEDILTRLEFQNLIKVAEGGLTEPFRSRIGWVIVKVDRIWSPVDVRREEAKGSFDAYRTGKEREYFEKRMNEIRAAAKIDVNQPLLDELAALVKEGKNVPEEYYAKELASVNARKIYAGDVRNVLGTHSEESLNLYLDRRIHQELIAQEVEKAGLEDAEFAKVYGMKRRHEVARVYLRETTEAAARVGDDEMADYYDRNKGKFAVPERRMLLAIETGDAGKSKKALERVKKGKDFRETAKTFNDGKEAKEQSGVVGLVRREDLIGDIGQKVFSMKRGEVAGPLRVTTPKGGITYVILKVEEIRPAGILPFEQVDKVVLRDRIVSRKRSEVFGELLPKLLSKHAVEFKGNMKEGTDHGENR